jgi:hypothetical protein
LGDCKGFGLGKKVVKPAPPLARKRLSPGFHLRKLLAQRFNRTPRATQPAPVPPPAA